jgi:predicted hydrocarbon binding protein
MNPNSARPMEMALPSTALSSLRTVLAAEAGADMAARVLRAAGQDAGDAFFRILSADADADSARESLGALDATAFWRRFAQLFANRGWGHLTHADVHPGIAALAAADWAESENSSHDGRPSCYFTTGLLANLLGRVAGSDVAVMEVECKASGDPQCRFLFGSPDALRSVYDMLLSGQSTDSAVAQLT